MLKTNEPDMQILFSTIIEKQFFLISYTRESLCKLEAKGCPCLTNIYWCEKKWGGGGEMARGEEDSPTPGIQTLCLANISRVMGLQVYKCSTQVS